MKRSKTKRERKIFEIVECLYNAIDAGDIQKIEKQLYKMQGKGTKSFNIFSKMEVWTENEQMKLEEFKHLALEYAVDEGKADVVNAIVYKGIKSPEKMKGALKIAVSHSYVQIVKTLLLVGANSDNWCLNIAISNNDIKMLEILLQARSNILQLCEEQYSCTYEELLTIAVQTKYMPAVKFLIDNGADARRIKLRDDNCLKIKIMGNIMFLLRGGFEGRKEYRLTYDDIIFIDRLLEEKGWLSIEEKILVLNNANELMKERIPKVIMESIDIIPGIFVDIEEGRNRAIKTILCMAQCEMDGIDYQKEGSLKNEWIDVVIPLIMKIAEDINVSRQKTAGNRSPREELFEGKDKCCVGMF